MINLLKRNILALLNAQIPVSFYIINEYNNKLALKDVGAVEVVRL
jgi:hypothetical protein